MALTSCGQVCYPLKTPYLDGTTHGVFAPYSKLRGAVTPAERGIGAPQRTGPVTDLVKPPTPRRAAMSCARRLKRVFGIEIEGCARCGRKLKLIAKILAHLEKTASAQRARAAGAAAGQAALNPNVRCICAGL
jgi:hypothetical protein